MGQLREWMNLVESTAHLPRKFWYNANGHQFFDAGTHADDVLANWKEMGLPEAGIREITGSTSHDPTEISREDNDSNGDFDEDYDDDYDDDFLDQNEGNLLSLAMSHGWVRGGYESEVWGPFLHGADMRSVRKAADYISTMYPDAVRNGLIIGTNDDGIHLQPNEIAPFIKRGKLPDPQ